MTVSQDTNLDDARERYILPNNFEEIDRMRNQHEWVKGCAAGLINAPIDFNTKGLKVLDSATADGTRFFVRHSKLNAAHTQIRLLDQ